MKLKLPADWSHADALSLTATDPHGRELWTWVWPTAALPENLAVANHPAPQPKLDVDGVLTSISVGGKEIGFKNGPRAVGGALKSATWNVDQSTGRLRLEYEYDAGGNPPFTGITFDYPEANVKSKRWLGLGPYRVWGNRLLGGTLNVWETPYNDGITGQNWIYPEFKGYFAGVRWMTLDTTEGKITIVPHDPALFVRVFTATFPVDNLALTTKVAFPPGDISILHTIPPIGAKGKRPASQPSVPKGTYSGTVDFYFGANP
jgi:hypothetical protein